MWGCLTANVTADTRYGDNYLICLPLFHVGALNPLLSIINLGGTATIMSEFDPVKIWEVFGDEQITVTLAVPAMLQFMLLTYDKDTHDTSSLRWVMSRRRTRPRQPYRDLRGDGHRDPPGVRTDRDLRPGVSDLPRRRTRSGRVDRQEFSSPRSAPSTKRATTAHPTSRVKCSSAARTSWSAT